VQQGAPPLVPDGVLQCPWHIHRYSWGMPKLDSLLVLQASPTRMNTILVLPEPCGLTPRLACPQAQVAELAGAKQGADKDAARAAAEAEGAQNSAGRAQDEVEEMRRQLAELRHQAQEAELAFSRVRVPSRMTLVLTPHQRCSTVGAERTVQICWLGLRVCVVV
jgi:hypothetical protein